MPVYNTPDADDSFIRAYTRCPTYQRRLDAWFNSSEFLDKAAETQEFRYLINLRIDDNDLDMFSQTGMS